MTTVDERLEAEKANLLLEHKRLHLHNVVNRERMTEIEHRVSAICHAQQEKRDALEGGKRDAV